jgi:hypothetical protein
VVWRGVGGVVSFGADADFSEEEGLHWTQPAAVLAKVGGAPPPRGDAGISPGNGSNDSTITVVHL